MSDLWVRVGLVFGALAIAAAFAAWQRQRARGPVRDVDTSMSPGVYFFSSEDCPTCGKARETLEAALGLDGYTEFAWEQEPSVFAQMEVDAVPAVLVVDGKGRGRLYPGQPKKALSRL